MPASDELVVYVSKFPPSPSGIGLYADVFARVLGQFGQVRRVAAPGSPRESQRMASALRGLCFGLFRTPAHAWVHVELSGRALYEFFLLLGVLLRPRRPRLVTATCHDSPSVVGAVFLFTWMERRYLRRPSMWLSTTAGAQLERWVLSRCDLALSLTHEGAEALSSRYGCPVRSLPHVIGFAHDGGKEDLVLIPGYVSDHDMIVTVLESCLSTPSGSGWRAAVGSCPPETEVAVLRRLDERLLARVTFLGQVSEAVMLETFSKARLVVRIGRSHSANSLAASGPLSWAVQERCVVLTDDDRAGARELHGLRFVARAVLTPTTLREQFERLAAGELRPPDYDLVQGRLGVAAVARYLRALLPSTRAGNRASRPRYGAD